MNIFSWIIFCVLVKQISNFSIQNQLEISFDLIEALEIQHCIVASDLKEGSISDVKAYSERNIPIAYMNYTELYFGLAKRLQFRTGVILSGKEANYIQMLFRLIQLVDNRLILLNYIWLIFLKDEYQMVQTNEFKIPFDYEVIVIQPKNGTIYTLTEIYMINHHFFSSNIGLWETEKAFGLKASNVSFYQRRNNYQKAEVRILIEKEDSTLTENYTPVVNIYVNETLNKLADMLNLSNRYDEYTEEAMTGVWDFIHTPFPFKTQSLQFGPLFKTLIYCYIKYPETHLRSDYYLQPFDASLWIVLFFLIVIGTIFILISRNFTRNKERFLADDLYLGLESFCNQCGNDVIKNVYLRSICILLRLSAIILICGYGAVITSFIAVKIVTPPFRNLEEFLSHGEYRFTLNKNNFVHLLLMNSEGTVYDKILTNFTKFTEGAEAEEICKDVCRKKYALLLDVNMDLDLSTSPCPCPIFKIPSYFAIYWSSLFVRPNSPYKRGFNKKLIRFFENGIEARFCSLRTLNLKKEIRPGDESNGDESFQPVLMDQMTQVLLIPFIGSVLGIGIVIVEIIKNSCLQSNLLL